VTIKENQVPFRANTIYEKES